MEAVKKMNNDEVFIKKDLKNNKIGSLLIILTIMLATALITVIGITAISIEKKLQQQLIMKSGSAYGYFKNVSDKQLQSLKKDNNIQSVGEQKVIGNILNQDISSPRLVLEYMDKNMFSFNNKELEIGALPVKSNEIAVERWVLDKLKINPTIGTVVTLRYEKNVENEDENKQPFDNMTEEIFILRGILKDTKSSKENNFSEIITSKEFINKNYEQDQYKYFVGVKLNNKQHIEQQLFEIGSSAGLQYKDIFLNDEYIKAQSANWEVIIPALVIILIIIFTAFVVIYNIFHVSIVSKVQQIGLLSVLGATPKQVKKIIFREGLFLSLIGIPFGVLGGCLLSFLISTKFNLDNERLQIYITPHIIIIAIFVSLFTAIISIRKPAKVASKISPIEAVRYSGIDSYKKGRLRKKCKIVNLANLAFINLWRNREKTFITILSLSMSGILFFVFSTILSSMNVENLVETYIRSDFQLNTGLQAISSKDDVLNNDLINEIKGIQGVKNVDAVYYTPIIIENSYKAQEIGESEREKMNSDLYGFNENLISELKNYLIEGHIFVSQVKSSQEVLLVQDSKWSSHYKVGDKITISSIFQGKDVKKEFYISGIVSRNIEWLGWSGDGPTFITSSDVITSEFDNKKVMRLSIDIGRNYEEIKTILKGIESRGNVTFVDKREFRDKQEQDIRIMRTAMLSLVGIIGIIAVINQINTMVTSIFSRRKEMGILQAIGLSDNQLVKLFQMEGLYILLIGIVISVPLGSILGYLFYTVFNKMATYSVYKYPLLPVTLFLIIILVIQLLITFVITNKLKKDSIVNRIQYNE